MSRTWKDKPIRIRLHENMKRGLIKHDHRERASYSYLSFWPDRELSLTFYKWAQKEINAHRALLDSLGDAVQYEEEETRSGGYYDRTALTRGIYEWVEGEKTVAFIVRRRVTVEPQTLCTDADHYDNFTKTDTRNGLRAVCTPLWTAELDTWRRKRVNRPGRAAVRAVLEKAKGLANAGELDPDYSDPIYEEHTGRKTWTWDD